ncbi:MAG: hypothetical protein H8D23_29975 [Candidatus Brocadiales bacterium]|nr:hypothetical protein [Candidatus Brocadiales bacterium]
MKNEIMEELWKVKDQVASEHGYDIHRLVNELREKEKDAKVSIVDLSLPHKLSKEKSGPGN